MILTAEESYSRMDTVLVSMLAEMKKMSETNAMLLSVVQQQTALIKEQKDVLYHTQASITEIQFSLTSLQQTIMYR